MRSVEAAGWSKDKVPEGERVRVVQLGIASYCQG